MTKNKTKAMIQEELTEAHEQLDEVGAALATANLNMQKVQEDITARDIFGDNRWRLMGSTGSPTDIDAYTVNNIIRRSRMAALLSPVIVAGLKVLKLFVFGQGVSISAKDESVDAIVQAFIRRNRKVMFGQRVRMQRVEELHRDGSLYLRFFSNEAGDCDIRFIDALEVQNVITNPDDKDEVWFYVRVFSTIIDAQIKTVAYPDINFNPTAEEKVIAEKLIELEAGLTKAVIEWDVPVYRITVNPTGKWGLPSYLAAMNWAKEYERFLEHRATLYAAYAIFATILKERVDRVKAARDSFNQAGKSPVKGSMATMTNEGSLDTLNTRNATTPPSEGLQFLEMVMMVFGYPPHMFGKEEPGGMGEEGRNKFFSLAIGSERMAWTEDLDAILDFAVQKKAVATNNRVIGEMVNGEFVYKADPTLDIKFPSLTVKDAERTISTLIDATTLKGQDPTGHISPAEFMRLAGPQLGIEDVETIVADLPEQWPLTESESKDFVRIIHDKLSEAMVDA